MQALTTTAVTINYNNCTLYILPHVIFAFFALQKALPHLEFVQIELCLKKNKLRH